MADPSPNVDLHQIDLVNNLEKLIDNQPESVDPIKADASTIRVSTPGTFAFTSSRAAFRADTLREAFPTIPSSMATTLFPLFEPQDLDVCVTWSVPDEDIRGHAFKHAVQVGPRFSVMEALRRKVDSAIASGTKQTRTMYEETGRLRKLLLDSVLSGALAQEDDPLLVRGYLKDATGGIATCDFAAGSVKCARALVRSG